MPPFRRPSLIEALEARWLCYAVTNGNDLGPGSLRQAILDANANPGADTITFAIPGAGAHALSIATGLPAITDTVTIDGFSQGGVGYTGPPLIRIDANTPTAQNAACFSFQNVGNNAVQCLAITRWANAIVFNNTTAGVGNNTVNNCYLGLSTNGRTPLGSVFAGLLLDHSNNNTISNNVISGNGVGNGNAGVFADSRSGNVFVGNMIGVDFDGANKVANGGQGIYLLNSANNRIGTNGDGTNDAAERNVISGNTFEGVVINGGAGGNVVAGNYIGLNGAGTLSIGNGNSGIAIYGGAPNNRIGTNADGTSDTLERNVIGGNVSTGIYVDAGGGNVIAGNFIGTDVTGKIARINSGGVYLNATTNNRIGTNADNVNDAAERNVISGNGGDGIDINGGSANVVAGNYIGLEVDGAATLGNLFSGIAVFGNSANNRIGAGAADLNPAAARNVISGNAFAGITLLPSTGNRIAGNYIGTDPTGKIDRGNVDQGIVLFTDATANRILQNVISANGTTGGFAGIEMFGPNVSANVVQGNFIGTDNGGSARLANGGAGVVIHNGAQSNLVGSNFDGTADAAERNVISGNNQAGVVLADTNTRLNTVAGNYIGTDVTGKLPLGNTLQGVLIGFNAAANTLDRNVIGANSLTSNFAAVEIYSAATANILTGNFIGVDATGATALGNGGDALYLHFGAAGNRIGTNGDGVNDSLEANVIANSAAGFPGVEIGDLNSNNNIVAGNKIGADVSGTIAMPNGGPGVFIRNGAANNQIGGASAVFGNLIANNASAYTALGGYHYDDAPGVVITDPTSTGNSIRANSIFNNRGLGIDLSATPAGQFSFFDGVNINHTTNFAAGPNHLQNYPVLLAATSGPATAVTGTLTGVPNTNYFIDLYASAAPNPSLFGDAQRYLGAVTVNTGPSGTVTFNVSLPAATTSTEYLTATATDPAGNTSEFSAARKLDVAPISLSATQWTPIGPAPISTLGDGVITTGRVADVVPDPSNTNVVYLASDTGGVWKTSNWGDANPTWTPLTDSESSLNQGVGYKTLAIAPSNPQVLYDAVSGPHSGILKSVNGGASWTLLSATQFPQTTFSSIIVDPTNPNVVYAGVWQTFGIANGVYKSTDGGGTWNNVTAATANNDVSDVVFDPNNPQTLYAGFTANPFTGNGAATAGVYKSINGGSSWTKLTSNLLPSASVGAAIRIAVAPSNSQTLYATEFSTANAVTRYRSTDGGTTWTLMSNLPTGNDDRYWHAVLAVDPTNALTVYANADHQLYRSSDGGVTWPVNPFAEDPVNVRFEPVSNAVIITGDRGIYRWNGSVGPVVNKQGNLQNTQNYTITLDPNDERTVYAISQDQGLIQKFSGVPVWNVTTSGDEVGRVLVDPGNSSRIYAFAAAAVENSPLGTIIRSDDGGATWVGKDSGLPAGIAAFPQAYTMQRSFVMDPANPHRLVLGLRQIYETTNDADSWHSISNNLDLSAGRFVSAVAIAPSAPNTIYAATDDGKLFVTTNNGSLWTERDANLPITQFNRVINIEIDPANPSRAFVVTGADRVGLDGPHVWLTTNAGVSWTNISSNLDPTVWAQSLAVDWRFANPILYLGTALGVQNSTVIGTTANWSPFTTGLPNAIIEDLQLLPSSNLLAAATYGRGIFEIRVGSPTAVSLANSANTVVIKRNGANADITVNGVTQQALIAQASTFTFTGGSANDSFTLDFSTGNPLPAGGVTFDGGAGANTLNLIGTTADDVLTAGPAGLTFSSAAFSNVPIRAANITQLHFPGGSGGNDLTNLASGSWIIDADTPAGSPNVSVLVQPAASATFTTDQRLANLTINGGLAQFVTASRKTLTVSGALSLTGNAKLDIGNNLLLLDNTQNSTAAVRSKLIQAYNFNPQNGIGNWDGVGGITSSSAVQTVTNGDYKITVGYIDGKIQTTYGFDLQNDLGGPALANNRILVRPALYGDLNFDGKVNGDDIGILIQFGYFGSPSAPDGWINGDLNYDGKVDGDDIGLIIQTGNFNSGQVFSPTPAASPAAATQEVERGASQPAANAPTASTATPSPTPPTLTRHQRHLRHLRHFRALARAAKRALRLPW